MKNTLWRLRFRFFGVLIGLMMSLPLSAQHIPVAPVREGVASVPAVSLLPVELEVESVQPDDSTWAEVRKTSEMRKSSVSKLTEVAFDQTD
ncbi:MAG TPA: hypothetical protein PLU80_21570, partial [Acidobacteriota bacterium]|nr:hypothetical protein [Acidobacteriota bacterium]